MVRQTISFWWQGYFMHVCDYDFKSGKLKLFLCTMWRYESPTLDDDFSYFNTHERIKKIIVVL